MLLVYLGRFRLVSINDAGAERVVAHVGSGASFGESALIGGRNADHTLIAEEHACVFELPKSELTGLLAKKPAEGRRVVETVLGMMLPTARPRTEAGPVRPGIPAPAPVAAATVIIGNDPKIARAKKATETLAKDDKPILVVGPTGSGKKTFARHFHRSGAHASAGYNELSIAGMDPARILPAIVGTEGGAAAGGGAGDMGLLELMGSGTLAICHAERLDAHQQHVLADYAQTGWFHRDCGRTAVQSRVRIVFVATGAEQEVLAGLAPSLRALVEGRVVSLPALAQRAKDIQPLAEHFLQLHSVKAGKRGLTLPREAVDRLVPYAWPGNVERARVRHAARGDPRAGWVRGLGGPHLRRPARGRDAQDQPAARREGPRHPEEPLARARADLDLHGVHRGGRLLDALRRAGARGASLGRHRDQPGDDGDLVHLVSDPAARHGVGRARLVRRMPDRRASETSSRSSDGSTSRRRAC